MYWKKKDIDYNILVPPILKPFEQFTKKEVSEYFSWYKKQINKRIEYLQSVSNVNLNYSSESLVNIWEWFLKRAETEKTPKSKLAEIKKELKGQPKEITEAILFENQEQFSLETEYIIYDIAMYFGEVCIHNNQSLSWGYHTDVTRDSFANRPLLVGFEDRDYNPPFKAHFDLNFIVRGIACNIFDGDQDKKDLLNIYDKWKRMIHN